MKCRGIIIIVILIVSVFYNVSLANERVSLGFIYAAKNSIELVNRTNGSINQVSPTCLNINSKGELVVTSDLTHEFVQVMKEKNIIVTPFLSNHWIRARGRAAIKNAENLTNQIIQVIKEYDLDGVNIDIENLTSDDKEQLTEFVRILKEKLPENKILTVSVAANPEEKDSGWQGSYDYQKLGEYADYLFVMTYDEHSQGGTCGPVASLEFVENSIKYALKYVSKDKIVMGIPLYGRYWQEGADTGGEAVAIGAIPTLISKNKGIVKYNEKIGEACLTFSINNPKIKSKINGVELEDGRYTIWYQNEESIKAKLNLVNKYDLLGAGVWALGQEKLELWEYYKNELNKIPYESEQEKRIRKEYEALVVDLSRMEEPNLFPLEYIKNGKKEFAKAQEKDVSEAHYHIIEENINRITYIKTKNIISMETKKIKTKIKDFSKEINEPKNHIYRLCRKDYKTKV